MGPLCPFDSYNKLTLSGTYITKFRFSFGTVPARFTAEESPVYCVQVNGDASGKIVNQIEITALHDGRPVSDKDETVTTLPEGGGSSGSSEEPQTPVPPQTILPPGTGDLAGVRRWLFLGLVTSLFVIFSPVLGRRRRRSRRSRTS